MSTSAHLYVDGVKIPDAKFRKMKAAWDSCRAAGVPTPKEVLEYFELEYDEAEVGREPLDEGVRVPLYDVSGTGDNYPYRKRSHQCAAGFDESSEYQSRRVVVIDLESLPADVKQLRLELTYG